nr:hypothetical protein [Tanacetum cinerariifolium]
PVKVLIMTIQIRGFVMMLQDNL